MKKSRTKFFSVFAILFVAIFAVSCCFFAACKGGSDDGGNSGDTGTQQGDDTGSGSGDGSVSGSGSDESGSGSGTEDGSESGPSQTVTQVVYLATSSDVQYTTAEEAVFMNESDLEITTSDGLTYTVSGTASVMGEAEAAWYATDDVDVGTPYVVIKIAVAEGESIYYENSKKTYTNDEAGKGDFDDGFIFIVCKLTFTEDGVCTSETKYTITAVGETEGITYTVSFADVELPKEESGGESGEGNTGVTAHTQSSDFGKLVETIYGSGTTNGADKNLMYEYLLDSGNGFLRLSEESSDNRYRYQSSKNIIEIKGDGLSVEMYGTGTVSVEIASTGSSNTSTFALKKVGAEESYEYLTGTATSGDATVTQDTDETYGTYYSVTGTGSDGYAKISFEISEPGEYILATNVHITTSIDRATRIGSVSVVDNYSDETTHTHIYTKTSDTTTCGVAGVKTFSCTSCPASATFDTSSIPTGEHTYEGAGAVSVTSQPTETATGTVTFTCDVCGTMEGAEGGVTTAELPVLSSTQYTRQENSSDSSCYDYTMTVNGFVITFTAAKVEAYLPSSETIIVGSTSTTAPSSAVTVQGDLATVTIAKNGAAFSYKSGDEYKKSIDGETYYPVKMESTTKITVTVTVDCTVKIACYNSMAIKIGDQSYIPVQADDGYYYVTVENVTAETEITIAQGGSESEIYFIEIAATQVTS